MPLTQADAQLVANTLLNTLVPDLSLPKQADGTYPGNKVLQLFEYAGVRQNQLVGLLNGLSAGSAVQLTDAQVQALAAQLAPVLLPALTQALVPALLTAMGHKLDGTPA